VCVSTPIRLTAVAAAKKRRRTVEAQCCHRSREVLMIVETGRVVNSGPLSSPRERGPDLSPRTFVPEVGADNSYNDLWPLSGSKLAGVTNSCELLPLGHMLCAAPLLFYHKLG
jgi:hypothetical protein